MQKCFTTLLQLIRTRCCFGDNHADSLSCGCCLIHLCNGTIVLSCITKVCITLKEHGGSSTLIALLKEGNHCQHKRTGDSRDTLAKVHDGAYREGVLISCPIIDIPEICKDDIELHLAPLVLLGKCRIFCSLHDNANSGRGRKLKHGVDTRVWFCGRYACGS